MFPLIALNVFEGYGLDWRTIATMITDHLEHTPVGTLLHNIVECRNLHAHKPVRIAIENGPLKLLYGFLDSQSFLEWNGDRGVNLGVEFTRKENKIVNTVVLPVAINMMDLELLGVPFNPVVGRIELSVIRILFCHRS